MESWQALRDGNLLLEWALNLMVLNVSTRKYHRAVRLPEGDLAKARGDGTSKSAVSRRFVALSRKKMKAWLASDLSELDLLVIQIDGLHVGDHVLMAAIGVDGNGDKHVLAVVEGATENTVVVQALIDNLLAREPYSIFIRSHMASKAQVNTGLFHVLGYHTLSCNIAISHIFWRDKWREARGATWPEIDAANRLWTIPGHRMKAGVEHRVPLFDAALAVLERAREISDGSGFIFPSPLRAGRILSGRTFLKVLRSAGLSGKTTTHGFRSCFRD